MDNLVANPKCKSCKSYWKPCETDILTSGLVAKTCKRCRDYQKELRDNRDFSKGKIYVIKSLTSPDIYVGSTVQTLVHRMRQHRKDYRNNVCLGKHKEIVKEINDWYIELYEEYPCNNFKELTTREGVIIMEIGTLNKNIAGRTKHEYWIEYAEKIKEYSKEYYIDNAEKRKEYYIKNAEKIKEYRAKNAEKRKEYDIIYRAKNANKLKEQGKEYYINNAEKNKEYRDKNAEKRKEYDKQYLQKDGIKERKAQNRRDSRARNKELAKQALIVV